MGCLKVDESTGIWGSKILSMKNECLFCEILEVGKEVVFENEHFYARFDLFPVSPGHCEIIPKRHMLSIFELTAEEWMSLQEAISKTVEVVESTDLEKLYRGLAERPLNEAAAFYYDKMLSHVGLGKKPDGYNFGNNDGEAAGRTVHHLHVHVIPRYRGDVEDPRGGIRHIIPGMGEYHGKK